VVSRVGSVLAAALITAGCSGGDAEVDRAGAERDAGPEEYGGEDFYAVPDPLPDGEHGDLLRYQAVDPQPEGEAEWWRVMYLSESLQGEPIAVTGMVGVPDGPAPQGGRPMVSVGNGTTGIADTCAPSRFSPELDSTYRRIGLPSMLEWFGSEWVGAFAEAGYVVAVTDYEGLGTPGIHPWPVGESEGRSVLDAARAARQLPSADAGERIALWGYSQGGHAVLWANQLAEDWAPELDLVGTVAGAPAAEFPSIFVGLAGVPELNDRFVLLVAGFAAAYPEADPSLVLTDAGMAVLEGARTSDACAYDGADLSLAEGRPVAREGFADVEPWASLIAANEPGTVATDSPVLVAYSGADDTTPVPFMDALGDRLCRLGQPAEIVVYDRGESHVAAVDDTVADGLAWIEARMAGDPAETTCRR
jgi:Secretory lipase